MKVTILGTGTSLGVPLIGCDCRTCVSSDSKDKRLRSSIYIELEGKCLVVDVGPDFRAQLLANKLSRLDAVFITHEHNDHVIGMDELRPLNFIQKKSIPIFAEERVLRELRTRFAYAFAAKGSSRPLLELMAIEPGVIEVDGVNVEAFRVMHGSLPILGYRIGDLAYITDAKVLTDELIDALEGISHLIINALRYDEHPAHLTLDEALEYISKIRPKHAYLTHLSHHFPPHTELQDSLPENVEVLYDGMVIEI